ncbi:hypothetical protein L9F63_010206 [Diploptera punctata]|uniref:G-protein coupled receptors family 1 profile domain-containing protein n=1 Tax=Diploptera punctata TaxID=6984 RepID=A0AAD8AJJ7_DIPPU|nr:hypothetical protein L9F63_010206 [Diploptera punctata]
MTSMLMTVITAQCPNDCYCSSYKSYCTIARLHTLPDQLPHTTELLKIQYDNISEIDNQTISKLSGFTYLKNLQLISVSLEYIESETFQTIPQLESLTISYNQITDLFSGTFQYLANLYFLDLSCNDIKWIESGTFYDLENVRHLNISNNRIKYIYPDTFVGIRNRCNYNNAKTLTTLDLSSSNPTIQNQVSQNLCAFNQINFGIIILRDRPTHMFSTLVNVTKLAVSFIRYGKPIIILNQDLMGGLYSIKHLDMSDGDIYGIKNATFQMSSLLEYLDLSGNRMKKIEKGSFTGLISLKMLNLNRNRLNILSNNSFVGLVSLRILNVSESRIQLIEPGTFEGLEMLRILDLSYNQIKVIQNNTFSGASMLRELILLYNYIQQIEIKAFEGLSNLKYVSNHLEHNVYFELPNIKKGTFEMLNRIDVIDLNAFMTTFSEIQLLKYLYLCINGTYINQQGNFQSLLQDFGNVTELKIMLVNMESTDILLNLSRINLSSLHLLRGTLPVITHNTFLGVSKIKSLTLTNCTTNTIQSKAFDQMKLLKELTLVSISNLTIETGSFKGLNDLESLSFINVESYNFNDGIFFGLNNLKQLNLSHNNITDLTQGIFNGLYNIEQIDLSNNNISILTDGIFGAFCFKEFELSCKNITSPIEYCNMSNALISLQHLNLTNNSITYIHSLTFIACTNLQTLDLSHNNLTMQEGLFLYTPALRNLNLEFCHIINIPNQLFECNPLLNVINLSWNFIKTINISLIQHLRQLKTIDMSFTPLECNCEIHQTWIWLKQKHIQVNIFELYKCLPSYIPIDSYLTNLNCDNSTKNKIITNRPPTINDYIFFKNYIEPTVLIIILLLGISTNGFLLFITLSQSNMRTKQNACIINLAITDILSLIFNIPLSYYDTINVRWELSETMCKIFIMIKDIVVAANIFSIVVLCIERFLVARSFKKLKRTCSSDDQFTIWFLMLVWVSAVVISLPAYFFAAVYTRCLSCRPDNQEFIRRIWSFQFIVCCVIPSIGVTVINVMTSLHLKESVRRIPGAIKPNIQASNRQNVANMMIVLSVIFIISYTPNFILRLLVAWAVVDIQNIFVTSFFSFCLFFCNAVFNPISLFIMSSKFKSSALRYFKFLEHRDMRAVIANRNMETDEESKRILQQRLERLAYIQQRFNYR